MPPRSEPEFPSFTAPERELIRRELCRHFGQDPAAADGLFLRTWRAGPKAGQPKLPPAIQSMVERGLVEVRAEPGRPPRPFFRAFFTARGLAALRRLVADRRAMDPVRFAHLRRELGLDAPEGGDTGEDGNHRAGP